MELGAVERVHTRMPKKSPLCMSEADTKCGGFSEYLIVATDNPLRAFNDMVFVFEYLLAFLTAASLASLNDRLIQTVCNLGVVLVGNPLLEHTFQFLRAALALQTLLHKQFDAFFHLAVRNLHTERELREVLEQRRNNRNTPIAVNKCSLRPSFN